MSRTFLRLDGSTANGSLLTAIPSAVSNGAAKPVSFTVSPTPAALWQQLQRRHNNGDDDGGVKGDAPVDDALLQHMYAPLFTTDNFSLQAAVPSTIRQPVLLPSGGVRESLCDDVLTDHEFIAASDKSGSSVVDLSRIRMIDPSILGARGGAFTTVAAASRPH